MADLFKLYNKTFKELIDIISNELPRDNLMETVKRQYTTAITTDRTLLLTETGKELFVYREYIANNKWDELINKDWESNINSVDNQQSIQRMISILRNIWINYDDDEKKHIKKLIKTLLSEYTKYLIHHQK